MNLTKIRWLRSSAWRAGRKIYSIARLEAPNNPDRNGEYWLADQILGYVADAAAVFLDIGANRGEWTAHVLSGRHSTATRVFAFEPESRAADLLRNRFNGESVQVVEAALSDISGEAVFHEKGPIAGTNSLYPGEGTVARTVQTLRLDEWVAEGVEPITMIKSDVEGHDLHILRGATELLARGGVSVWQFEYNWRWLQGGSSLYAVFQLLETIPYHLGKLYRNGIELYVTWHPELDRFFETQYVLIREGSPILDLARVATFTPRNTAV